MKRYSRKREAILQALRSTTIHPTAEWVYMKLKPEFPDLSLATVYRNIAAFIESGELVSVGVVDSKERYDADTHPHSHFICERCGAVMDVKLSDDSAIDKQAEETMEVRIFRHELTFRGICNECLKNKHIQS
ncbi:MAG: transcriptional repressor [Oscillospiraceae bacterium]